MSELQDNSHSTKAVKGPAAKKAAETPKKKVEPVIDAGIAKTKKKGLGARFKETFVQDDGGSVARHVWHDILVPSAKDVLEAAAGETVHRILFGDSPRRLNSLSGHGGVAGALGRQVYANHFATPATQQRQIVGTPTGPALGHRERATHDFSGIILPSRAHAEHVLVNMLGLIEQYQEVTVRDLLDLCNLKPEFTDEKFGWVDLSTANVARLRGGSGWIINLPPTQQLD